MPYTTNIREIDESTIRPALNRVVSFSGPASKGPFQTSTVISSETALERIYGKEISGFDAIANARQALRAGTQVRFSRAVHMTDVNDFSTRTSVAATTTFDDQAGVPLPTLRVTAIHEGTWANGVNVTVGNASNGDTEYFKLTIESPGLGIPAAVFDNILMADVAALTHPEWLIEDLGSATPAPANRPANGTQSLATGDNGTASWAAADYISTVAANCGIYPLAEASDFIDVMVPNLTDITVNTTFVQQAEANGWLAHIAVPPALSASDVQDYRMRTGTFATGTAIESTHASMHFGDLNYVDLLSPSGATADFDNAGGLAGVLGFNDTVVVDSRNTPGPHLAPSGPKRGVSLALGVHANILSDDKQDLLNKGINYFETFNGRVQARGNRTMSFLNKKTKLVNVRRMLLQLRRDIRPILEGFFDEPNDPELWRFAFSELDPVLEGMVADRAIFDYVLNTDHKAQSVNDPAIQLNTPAVIDAGQFKILIRLKPIAPVEEIDVTVIIDSTSVNYDEV